MSVETHTVDHLVVPHQMPSIHTWYDYLSNGKLKVYIIMNLEFTLVRHTKHRCGKIEKKIKEKYARAQITSDEW